MVVTVVTQSHSWLLRHCSFALRSLVKRDCPKSTSHISNHLHSFVHIGRSVTPSPKAKDCQAAFVPLDCSPGNPEEEHVQKRHGFDLSCFQIDKADIDVSSTLFTDTSCANTLRRLGFCISLHTHTHTSRHPPHLLISGREDVRRWCNYGKIMSFHAKCLQTPRRTITIDHHWPRPAQVLLGPEIQPRAVWSFKAEARKTENAHQSWCIFYIFLHIITQPGIVSPIILVGGGPFSERGAKELVFSLIATYWSTS